MADTSAGPEVTDPVGDGREGTVRALPSSGSLAQGMLRASRGATCSGGPGKRTQPMSDSPASV